VLEKNIIHLGDCIELIKQIPDNTVDLILTDIPYNSVSKKGEDRAKYKGQLRKIDKEEADILTFDLDIFLDECYRIVKGSVYIFCGKAQISPIYNFFDDKKDMMTRHCIWHKTNPTPMNGQHFWLSSTEDCIFAKKRNTVFNQRCKHNVWDFPSGRSKVHPTEKPLKLFQYLVESSSIEGGLVLDPCIGSGTTAVACLNTNREFIGIEKELKYVQVANQRIQNILRNG
jgi:site-specific DNA-methyltransferase (adenine-specific)